MSRWTPSGDNEISKAAYGWSSTRCARCVKAASMLTAKARLSQVSCDQFSDNYS